MYSNCKYTIQGKFQCGGKRKKSFERFQCRGKRKKSFERFQFNEIINKNISKIAMIMVLLVIIVGVIRNRMNAMKGDNNASYNNPNNKQNISLDGGLDIQEIEAFQSLDKYGKGKISLADLKNICRSNGKLYETFKNLLRDVENEYNIKLKNSDSININEFFNIVPQISKENIERFTSPSDCNCYNANENKGETWGNSGNASPAMLKLKDLCTNRYKNCKWKTTKKCGDQKQCTGKSFLGADTCCPETCCDEAENNN